MLNKKGVFFEVVILVGFFFLLFNALIIGLSTDSQTGILVEKSTNVINFEKYLENYNNMYKINTQIFIENKISDYLSKFYLHKCPSYRGLGVINSDCFNSIKSHFDVIEFELLEYCRLVFDIDCTLKLEDNKIVVIADKQNIEIPRTFGLRGKYNYTLQEDFFSSNLEVYKNQNVVKNYFSECSDLNCINLKFTEFSNKNFSLVKISNHNLDYLFFYELINKLKFCFNAIDNNCNCFNFDLSLVPEGYKIEFESLDEGLLVKLIDFEKNVVLRQEFIFAYITQHENGNLIDSLYLTSEGFFLKENDLKTKNFLSVNKNFKLFFSSTHLEECETNVNILSSRDIINDFFSREVGNSFNLKSSFNINVNVTNLRPNGLKKNTLYYNYDGVVSNNFIENLENELEIVIDNVNEIFLYLSDLSLNNNNVSFLYVVDDYETFSFNLEDNKTLENKIFSSFLRAVKKSFPVDYYDFKNMVAFELIDSKENSYNFSFVLKDEKPPVGIKEVNTYPVDFMKDTYILEISGLVADIESLGFYFSETLDKNNLVKYYIGNYDDYQKINDFSVEKVFVNAQGKIAYYNDPANLFVLNSEFVGKSNVEQAHNDPDVSIETNYYFLIENLNNKLLITTFDKNANENKSYYQVNTDFEFNLIPNKTICNIDSFNIQTQSFVCEKPSKTIFGNLLDENYLENKIYWGCLNSKNEVYFNLNDLNSGFMNSDNYESCIENSKELFFLSFYDLNDNLMNFIKEYFERNQGIDNKFLEFLNIDVYKLKKETTISGTSTTERFIVEIA